MDDLRTSLIGVAITVGCVAIVTIRVASASPPTPRRQATPEERAEIAQTISGAERGWINETTQNFPRDHWSQRDDFHGREYKQATQTANEKQIRIEDVLRAVDDDIHKKKAMTTDAPDDRNATAVPCKPRPFYD
jgi:hypothetical protein